MSDATDLNQPANAASVAAEGGLPLRGVRILDMATVLAAPMGATLCADLGAEVVKLELPDGSDPMRGLAPVQDGQPLFWKVANRGKKGISLDVRQPQGRELLLKLLAGFDVLVENFRPGTLDRWGLGIDVLHAANPRLVVLRLTGFGQDGPGSGRPGFARIFEAMSGLTKLSGEKGGSPLHMNYPIGDVIAASFAAFSIASAMVRMRTEPQAKGFEIDLAATEALFRLLDALPVEYERLGVERGPAGNLASYTAPSSMYCSRDGVHLSLVASSNPIFRRLAVAIGLPQLVEDSRFATMVARVDHYRELDAILDEWFRSHDYAQIAQALEPEGVPFARVQGIAQIVHDPQFVARHAIVRLADPDLGSVPAPHAVPRIIGHAWSPPRTGPAVGEHNREIFGAIGLSDDQMAQLRRDGVI
jgi:crotonobetainyl-CoA:carnitine CoA-transferase CaiB-like acyl-CoA transferase